MPWRLRAHPLAFRPELERETHNAREQVAQDLLDLAKVRVALLSAARNGQQVCIFRPARPIDLRGTVAAETLRQWVEKEGLTIEWGTPENVLEHGVDTGQLVAVAIRWDYRPLAISLNSTGGPSL